MDLFYGTSFEEQVKAFKKDLKAFASVSKEDLGKNVFIAYGNPEYVGNCLMVVGPPLRKGEKPFHDKYSKYLLQTINDFGLPNTIITSCYLIPKEQVSKVDIKNFSNMMSKLLDIFQPKLIVVLGEDAQFSFLKRKCILRDCHGKAITTHNDAPIIASYQMDYYLERSEFEDPSYKEYIRQSDWNRIAVEYKKRIK
jgi:uracil-DNA glycosylase